MIARADQLATLTPAQRAKVIYAEAQSQLSSRLWRAALGDSDRKNDRDGSPLGNDGMKMDSLLGLIGGQEDLSALVPGQRCTCHCACCCHGAEAQADSDFAAPSQDRPRSDPSAAMIGSAIRGLGSGTGEAGLRLGANARYGWVFAAAQQRTGIPAPALAAIVDAEAAKSPDGSWNALSRNPRSSAAGLGQFLSGTWQTLAQTPGTWLHGIAAQQGWLDGRGKIEPASRSALLTLRYDPQASIACVADMAKLNLDKLEKSGVRVRSDAETLAKAAYLSHHLGFGDACKFLREGIAPDRARMLLAAQIGENAAERRIADAGNATQAHRQWLLGFIDRRIRPEKFAS